MWRAKTNNWRAITRLRAGVPVAHPHRRVPHSRLNRRHLAEPDCDTKRRACLAFACWVARCLLCDALGLFPALMAAFAAKRASTSSTDNEPRRRTSLDFALLVCCSMRFGDLGAIAALNARAVAARGAIVVVVENSCVTASSVSAGTAKILQS